MNKPFGWAGMGRKMRRFTKDPIMLEYGDEERPEYAHEEVYNVDQADVVISETYGVDFMSGETVHRLVLDLDGPHQYYESTTPGHGHLYLDNDLSWEACVEIMDVLAKHGILQEGYAKASKARGYSAVRLPWIRKPERVFDPFEDNDSESGWRRKKDANADADVL